MTRTLAADDPKAVALAAAVAAGDLDALRRLLDGDPGLASVWIGGGRRARTPLHLVTDWPGYPPRGPEVARLLIAAGADPSAAPDQGRVRETPLHWVASTDDVDVAEVLLDAGADVEAPGGSIAGTPLANAVGYGCWHVARLLVSRGARVDELWLAAALGGLTRVEQLLTAEPPPSADDIDHAFWQACHGGQRRAAERLLVAGADPTWRPDYADTSAYDVVAGVDTRRSTMQTWLGGVLGYPEGCQD